MILIIDGYNVLKQSAGPKYIDSAERDTFIHQLSSYAQRKGHTIIVVFDGFNDGDMNNKQKMVKVIYSGNQSADDNINDLLTRYRAQEVVLISSDRALREKAAQQNIVSVDSCTFYKYLLIPKKQPKSSTTINNHIKKLSELNENITLDELMHQAACMGVEKHDEEVYNERISKKTKSKKERKLEQILKKL